MKKMIATTLAILMVILCTSCGTKVSVPEGYPDYTFTSTPDTAQLRQTAMRAMRDLLSIEWTPAEGISYYNTAGLDKQFDYNPGTTYGGVLYSGASSGLFHFLEFYDLKTGTLTYPGTGDELRRNIGSGCADSLLWSWATVSNSFSCGYYPSMMVHKNGFLPVGDYTYNFKVDSYYNLPTKAIIESNGEDVILDAYTKTLPADALISSSSDHAMMVIENPTVVYLDDGTIDAENSFFIIQDQRGGAGDGFMEEVVNGHTVHFNSVRSQKFTFDFFIKHDYIPVTVAEFTGEKPYEEAKVILKDGDCNKLTDAQSAIVESNYPLAVLNLIITDENGSQSVYDRLLIHSASAEGPTRTYDLAQWDALQEFDADAFEKLQLEVVVSTGQRFILVDINL